MRHFLTIFLLLLPRLLLAKPNALPPPVVPQCFGVNAVSGEPDTEGSRLEVGGFGWAGVPFRWADMEKTKGVYDFTDADALVTSLTAHHLKPLFLLDANNGSYPPGPAASTAFTQFVTAAARRCRGKAVLWEVGPGVPAAQTAHAIRAADPGATVVLATALESLSASEKRGILADADAVLFAPTESAPEDMDDDEATRRLIRAYSPPGKDVALITASVSEKTASTAPQAQFLVRRWLSDLAAGVRLSLCDDVTSDTSAPPFLAARTLTRTLNGYRFVKRVPLTSPDDYLLLFARGADGLKMAAWTSGPDHEILLPVTSVSAATGMTGDDTTAVPSQGRLSLTLTGGPAYLDVSQDAALRQAGAWAAAAQNEFYAPGQPLRLALTYHNPDAVPHRVRFVALLTTPGGGRTPVPAGEDIVGPHQALTLGMQAPGLAGSPAQVRVGLILDGRRQPYPQDVGFAPLSPLALTVAPLAADRVQVRINDPGGAAFAGRLSAAGPGGIMSVPVTLRAGQTSVSVSVPVRPDAGASWRLRDQGGRLAATLPAQRLVPYALTLSAVQLLPADGPAALAGGQRIRYGFAPGHLSWQIGEEQPPPLPGRPTGYGLWVFGDDSGNRLWMEFQDNAGQTSRVDGGSLTWTGWRFVTFPLRAGSVPPEYPVKLTTLLGLISRPDARRQAGTLLWKGPAILYGTVPVPHRV